MIPCVIFEDEHLLVVNKPAGWNTHAPSPFAGEGIYDWLKHREPRWGDLAIIHRLDKETSGVMVFGKNALANRSLTEQFAGRSVEKEYVLLSERTPQKSEIIVKSRIARSGERYISGNHGDPAETKFIVRNPEFLAPHPGDESQIRCCELIAQPLTGRTHQIRVHATANGFPILGDALYGGRSFQRLCLHALSLSFIHPITNKPVRFEAAVNFSRHWRNVLTDAIFPAKETNAFRLCHGASDGVPKFYLDALGDFVLAQFDRPLDPRAETPARFAGSYFKLLNPQIRKTSADESCPKHVDGKIAPDCFVIRENGVKYELSFNEGYSVGLFLDQRDNRRRLLTGHVAADFRLKTPDFRLEILNTFAYTCGFSVCAALGGARTTSLDLSKKYLEWGKRNFASNGLDPAQHDFIYGDAFDWLKRLTKNARSFDVVILDPPTFSQSKKGGVFRAEKDYGKLVTAALAVLKRGGVLFAATNAAGWKPEDFLAQVGEAIRKAGRKIIQQHYVPQPPDFPVSRAEPAYLKTVWLRVG